MDEYWSQRLLEKLSEMIEQLELLVTAVNNLTWVVHDKRVINGK